MEHPITPPPELVRQWAQADGEKDLERFWAHIATQSARWGADQELEACVTMLSDLGGDGEMIRRARRQKPPSKKEALNMLEAMERVWEAMGHKPDFTIRRALEALPD